ncbi:hypothetical protein A3A39_03130 [Candidatus Kaiserbacteria bacterium RIFCSPLOWO2_01_FULL_54_13]|uniref:Uncharacterized protein n=1 Tax=Candidatus Kaiserbacteria bacterium RIFCSPLOWO2_01_FULL_54_13 TaxID=1798512 RepID=A0A1F6F082_9BACT|nr:MAG: hypothetical protein A3A39_03130 [Candidatus Kaiserbacteria bacterium RIFCSPLOWO2_01_FULL_54_13]
MTRTIRFIALGIIGLTALPFLALAQPAPPGSAATPYQYQNTGIFGCNQVAGANASAGTMAAIGGVYVPVNDAAVTLNTGILVYKECVLRPLQDRLRESAMTTLFRRQFIAIETGREGNKQYVVIRTEESAQQADRALYATLTDEKILSKLHPAFKDTVRSSVARSYRAGRQPESQLECSYKGNVVEVLKGKVPVNEAGIPDVLGALTVLVDPACNPMGAYSIVAQISNERATQAVKNWEKCIEEGRGFYCMTDNASDPLKEKILTPASVVQESYQQILNSPVEQLQSANDIGQMIGALYAGITTQIISDSQGLAGLSQGIGGQASYLQQVTGESSQGVIGAAVNAALQILNSARQIETRYLAAMNSIVSSLTQTINRLRAAERMCWDLIIPEAQTYASTNGFQIQPATSTAFSQQVIESQVAPLAQAAVTNFESSQRALGLIDQLIAGVTNTASLEAQRLALQQLDTLVAQNALHTPYDAQNAEQQRNDIAGATETLVTDTVQAWGDSPDPAIGWCNINNPTVVQAWAERWRR